MAHGKDPDPRGNDGNPEGKGRQGQNQNQLRSSGAGTEKTGRTAASDAVENPGRDRQGRGPTQAGGSAQGGGNLA